MARLLLRFDGSPAVLLLFGSLQACVIPLGPDFTDPPAAQNFPPEILGESPAAFSISTATVSQKFQVRVTDPNISDDLHVRWLADFPPLSNDFRDLPIQSNTSSSTIAASKDGSILNALTENTIDCLVLSRNLSEHRIIFVVADRDFISTSDPTAVAEGGRIATTGWTLSLTCPPL